MATLSIPARSGEHSGRRLQVSDAALEWLKWIGVAAMILDHVNWFLLAGGRDPQATPHAWMNDIGRLAFPLFAFCFGVNLVRVIEGPNPDVRVRRMFRRLLFAGIVAQCAYWPLRDYFWPLNVLWTFALAAGIALLWVRWPQSNLMRLAAFALFVVAGIAVEYWWFGLALVFAAMAYASHRTLVSALPFAAGIVALCLLNGSVYAGATLAVIALLAGAQWAPRRIPGLLHVFYAAHLWLLLAVAFVLGRFV